MQRFNAKLKDYLTVYKVPLAPNSLDPALFYTEDGMEHPILLPGVHAHICRDLQSFVGGAPARIKHCVIVGDAVTPGKKRNQPVKVIIHLNKDLMDQDVDGLCAEQILKTANSLSGKMVTGTTRPVRYVPVVRDLDQSEHEAVYDVLTQRWLKLPRNL